MKAPIILRADDGISWWKDAASLECYVESPDIEDGIFTVRDTEGQVLNLSPLIPVKRGRLFGLRTVSVSPGVISETGQYESEILHALIAAHIRGVWHYNGHIPEGLPSILELLCRLQPASR